MSRRSTFSQASMIRNDMVKKSSAFNSLFMDKKLSGDSNPPIFQTIQDFELCSRQLALSENEKRDLFINGFNGASRHFFFENCRVDMKLRQLRRMIVEEYDSDNWRLSVQPKLEMLTMDRSMQETENMHNRICLAKFVDRINILKPQCLPNFRSENNKIRHVRSALIERDWSKISLGNKVLASCSCIAFVTELSEQFQLNKNSAGYRNIIVPEI